MSITLSGTNKYWQPKNTPGPMLFIRSLILIVFLPLIGSPVSALEKSFEKSPDGLVLKFPGTSEENWQAQYPVQLMQLALSKIHDNKNNYQLAPSEFNVPKGRNFQLLEEGKLLHFMWSTATQERVDQYHAVPFPIMKGLFGLRVALVHQTQKNLFESVNTIEDLRFFIAGQMHIWTDAKIFKHNEINVYDSPNYEVLFDMLANKRFDYFPRAIVEALPELQSRHNLPIVLDEHLLIRYPTALYFYVHSQQLADDVMTGLEAIVKSGEFDKLFLQYHEEQLQRLNLEGRRAINLENPFAPDNLPISRDELWLSDLVGLLTSIN